MPTNKTIREAINEVLWDNVDFDDVSNPERPMKAKLQKDLESFLHSTLLTQLQEIEEMVEGMKYKSDDLGGGWAVDAFDILLALKEKKSNLT